YLDLVERAVGALTTVGPFGEQRAVRRLRATGPCLMCELALVNSGPGAASRDLLQRGRDPTQLALFATETEHHWAALVCRECSPGATGPRCRLHLIRDGGTDLSDELRAERP